MSVLLFDYICTRRAELGTMPACPVAVTTVVSTPMLDALAKKHGVALRKVLTGFKYIGEQVGLLEQEGQAERFLFGCEESCGYLTGLSVRDKDAVNAVMLLCQMAAYHKARGKNLAQALMGLYETYGFYQTALLHFAFEGACGMDRMGRILDHMRRTCTAHFAGYPVQSRVDYEADKTGLPQCNMLFFALEQGGCVFIRPSGTEPKLKAVPYRSCAERTAGRAKAGGAANRVPHPDRGAGRRKITACLEPCNFAEGSPAA